MAKKAALKQAKANPLSQLVIGASAIVVLVGAYEAATQNDFTSIAPTQLFLIAVVLGVLGLYLKGEK